MQVMAAAAQLDVGEFHVFELAYERWYGKAAPEASLERLFGTYLRNQIVPPWVRHYARSVTRDAERAGRRVTAAPAASTEDEARLRRLGLWYLLVIVAATVLLYLLAARGSPELLPSIGGSPFPPSY